MLGRTIYFPYRDSSKALCLTIIYKCVIFNNFSGKYSMIIKWFYFLNRGLCTYFIIIQDCKIGHTWWSLEDQHKLEFLPYF